MDSSEVKDTSQCVRVAVNVRPLVTHELVAGCTDCITAVPGEPQVLGMSILLFNTWKLYNYYYYFLKNMCSFD